MKHTPLFDRHMRDASAVLNLKGVARAMQYEGHIAEHLAVRQGVSLCDVSHMGELSIEGPDAIALAQKLITNDVDKLLVNQAMYSVMCNENGNIIDDMVCLRVAPERLIWVVNVTKTEEDYQWVVRHSHGMNVQVTNISTDTALLALQGPESREVLQRITKADLSTLEYYWLAQTSIHTAHAEVPCIVSRTGYTGERGYEIMVAQELAPWVWDELLVAGRPLGIIPHGVAARESLRTEAGYLLNGNDMDGSTNPFEAGLGWVVKFSKEFVGKRALAAIKANGPTRKLVGLEVDGHRTIRNGYPIFSAAGEVGRVTSGPLSPDLAGRNLGLGYVEAKYAAVGTELDVGIGGTRYSGRIVAIPFCPRRAKEEPTISTHSPYRLSFSDKHVWVHADETESDVVTVGLSDFGQRSLGDILSVDLPKVGDELTGGSIAGWVDSYRKPFDIVSPVSGVVLAVAEDLVKNPRRINAYPYERHGLFKVRASALEELDTLMQFDAYSDLVRRLQYYGYWSQDRRTT